MKKKKNSSMNTSTSQQQQEQKEPPKKRLKRRRSNHNNNNDNNNEQQQNVHKKVSVIKVVVPPTVKTNESNTKQQLPVGVQQKKQQQVQNNPNTTTTAIQKNQTQTTTTKTITTNTKNISKHTKKNPITIEWEQIRQRYKRKKYNLQNEIDIGNVISSNIIRNSTSNRNTSNNTMTRNTRKRHSEQQQQQDEELEEHDDDDDDDDDDNDEYNAKTPTKSNQKKKKKQYSNTKTINDLYNDNNIDDQSIILQQLLLPSQQNQEQEENLPITIISMIDDNSKYYQHNMDIYEYGTIPPKYNNHRKTTTVRSVVRKHNSTTSTTIMNQATTTTNKNENDRNNRTKKKRYHNDNDANNDDTTTTTTNNNNNNNVYMIHKTALSNNNSDRINTLLDNINHNVLLLDFNLYNTNAHAQYNSSISTTNTNNINSTTISTSYTSFVLRRNIYRTIVRYLLSFSSNSNSSNINNKNNSILLIQQHQSCIITLWKLIQYIDLFTIPSIPRVDCVTNNYNSNKIDHNNNYGIHENSGIINNNMNTNTTTNTNHTMNSKSTSSSDTFTMKSLLLNHICRRNGIHLYTYYIIQQYLYKSLFPMNKNTINKSNNSNANLNIIMKQIAYELGVVPSQQLIGSNQYIGTRIDTNYRLTVQQLLQITLQKYFPKLKLQQQHKQQTLIQSILITNTKEVIHNHKNNNNINSETEQEIDNDSNDDVTNFNDSNNNNNSIFQQWMIPNQILIPPSTNYIPKPGTQPPIPPKLIIPSNITLTTNNIEMDQSMNLLFGPTDPYEHVVHTGRHIIDDSIYKVTISSILQQMALVSSSSSSLSTSGNILTDLQQRSPEQNHMILKLLQKQLLSLLQQIVRINQSNYYIRISRQVIPSTYKHQQSYNNSNNNVVELPLSYFYHALMEYCSIVLSGIVPIQTSSTIAFDDDDALDNHNYNSKKDVSVIPIIEHVYELLEAHIHHNGLQMFTKLHVLHGLLRISKALPNSGITIISQPIFENQTPIHILRQLIEHLETNHYLTQSQSMITSHNDRTIINVGEFEYVLYRSLSIFRYCIEREPYNVYYHCWYIGTLAISLLLCSGQQVIPTSTSTHTTTTTDTCINNNPIKINNIRRQLPKFHDIRKQLAIAFRALLDVSVKHSDHRTHCSIISFLEWNQIISILLGPNLNKERRIYYQSSIRQLHDYHKLRWAYEENTSTAYKSLQTIQSHILKKTTKTTSTQSNNKNFILHELASKIEMCPSEIDHWRAIVHELGPLNTSNCKCSIPRTTDDDDDDECKECSRFVNGKCEQRRTDTDWWGSNRKNWWYECLLQPNVFTKSNPKSKTSKTKRSGVATATNTNATSSSTKPTSGKKQKTSNTDNVNQSPTPIEIVISKLKELEPYQPFYESTPVDSNGNDKDDASVDINKQAYPSLLWYDELLTLIDKELTKEKKGSKRRKKESIYTLFSLESHNQQVHDNKDRWNTQMESLQDLLYNNNDDYMTDTEQSNTATPNMELIGYKIIIICHLYSTIHSGIDIYINQLFDIVIQHYNCINTNMTTNCAAFITLSWLYRMGLDVTKIM